MDAVIDRLEKLLPPGSFVLVPINDKPDPGRGPDSPDSDQSGDDSDLNSDSECQWQADHGISGSFKKLKRTDLVFTQMADTDLAVTVLALLADSVNIVSSLFPCMSA